MSLEATLERIAVALEKLALCSENPVTAAAPAAEPAKEKPKADKKAEKPAKQEKASKPKAKPEPKEADDDFDDDADALTKEDVRAAFGDLVAVDPAAPKAILKEFGAAKLSDLDADDYAKVIERAKTWGDDD